MLLNNLRTFTHINAYILISMTYLLMPYLHVTAAPNVSRSNVSDPKQEFDKALQRLLSTYYDKVVASELQNAHSSKDESLLFEDSSSSSKIDENKSGSNAEARQVDIYDQMLGDQPVTEGTTTVKHSSPSEDINKSRDRLRKESWTAYIRSHVLNSLRGGNITTITKPPEDSIITDFNITQEIFNSTIVDSSITEKLRSFYPLCNEPQNQEEDQWKDSDDIMNLSFNLDYTSENRNSNIATATLRLYRLQNTTSKFETQEDDCRKLDNGEEDKLIRVSVYWYMKQQKKRRFKKRLSDSKVTPENVPWVELSIKPATKSWNRASNKNLRLGIVVEDQENNVLRADKYFKGAFCTVGVSTPKPIPTIIRDTTQGDELQRIQTFLGTNSTVSADNDLRLLATVDICYLEYPENIDSSQINPARINACNLRKAHEDNLRLVERERLERKALSYQGTRHIRHQRQHRQSPLSNTELSSLTSLTAEDVAKLATEKRRQMSDLERTMRNSMSNNQQIILTREELEALQRGSRLNR